NGTMEPQLPDIVEASGGIVVAVTMRHGWVYPQVKLDLHGDIRDQMARHQLEIYHTWRTRPRLEFAKKLVKEYRIDGVVYNSAWGCRRFSPAARLNKEEFQNKMGIPVLLNDFYTFGEHINQLKTRIGAFIEILRK
ncbi:MAG: 2-hydroxyacyl-CoA dehydratase family protein, partial [Candidatus Helarchaeota archaeon]|nr:2-hydroxyacyl-CoA dehydratase family protein [Candidatus Helarchaeota archaeon]